MKRIVVLSILVVVAAVGATTAAAATPAKQPVATGFYRGQTIRYYDFGPIKLAKGNAVAPIWTVRNGVAKQHNVVDTVPGRPGYTPLWQLNEVTFKAGVTPRLLASAAQVKAAEQRGDVSVRPTTTIVNCPVLGFGQKRISGFSDGHAIHYYDDGAVKVRAGNVTAPLYAPTNGVPGQHNVALESIGVGQTLYPALWSIVSVTWKPGAPKVLLRSAAQVKAAAARGELTVERTSLVVNCPVVL